MQITIDSALKALIPALSAEEFRQLEANILADGRVIDPLVIWKFDGKNILLDGHNRYKISEKLGMKFETIEQKFEDCPHAELWVAEHQVGRRNLTDDQRSVIANDIRELRSEISRAESAKENAKKTAQPVGSKVVSPKDDVSPRLTPVKSTRSAVAKEAKVPERKLRTVQEIKAKPGGAELIAKVRAGTMTLPQAKSQALKAETKQFKADRAVEAKTPSLAIFLTHANTFFVLIDAKLAGTISDLKMVDEIPLGLQISGKELVKILRKISKHAAEYADKLENSLRR